MKVTLRQKKLRGGKIRLYLDFYPPIEIEKGKTTRREFLDLFIYENPKGSLDKKHNKETLLLAESIKADRILEVQQGKYGFLKKNNNEDFLEYFNSIVQKRYSSKGNYDNWLSSYNYLKKFHKEKLTFDQVDERFVIRFKEFLLTENELSQNSALSYFNKFKAALNVAFEEKLIENNPAKRVKGIKAGDTHREFLTLEEVKRLAKTECEIPILKKAAIFSVYTGLRWSDIQKLTWKEIEYSKASGWFIRFKQKKTKGSEMLPFPDYARKLLGEKKESNEKVFPELKYSAWNNLKLNQWAIKAGITKKITFHSFRHTFATLQLSLGTDIFTVSKMLGHKDLKTTLIYTKLIDEKKIEAANRIPDLENQNSTKKKKT